MYKDMSSTRNGPDNVQGGQDVKPLPTGVGYIEAQSHPTWFLKDTAGQRIEWQGWPNHWMMDIGLAAYQSRWLANVEADLTTYGFDGVWIDNNLMTLKYYSPTHPSAKYPTDAALQAATRSALANIGPALKRDGYTVVANITDSRNWPGVWADWIQFTSGAHEEMFVKYSTAAAAGMLSDYGPPGWKAQVDELPAAAAQHKFTVVMAQGPATDAIGFRYAFASYMLGHYDGSLFAYGESTPWFPEFSYDLGPALGPYYSLGGSLYRRDFTKGVALVNASPLPSSRIVNLGKIYLDEDNHQVTQITLNQYRGMVLRTP
jgi:hypothetical protein